MKPRMTGPRTDDVLVSKVSATVAHEVKILPASSGTMCPTHDAAVAQARELGRSRCVDVWLTEDHIHFLKIASFREGAQPEASAAASVHVSASG